jgi:hypothetical protein
LSELLEDVIGAIQCAWMRGRQPLRSVTERLDAVFGDAARSDPASLGFRTPSYPKGETLTGR